MNVDSNRAVHEADIVLNEFRQQLRTDLRTQAHRGRVSSESIALLKSRLAEVRADVLATLVPARATPAPTSPARTSGVGASMGA